MLWDNVSSIGLPGLVTLFVISVWRGWLVSRRVYQDAMALQSQRLADKDKHIAELVVERDTWRDAAQTQAKTATLLAAQNGEYMELAKTGVHALESFPRLGDRRAADPE